MAKEETHFLLSLEKRTCPERIFDNPSLRMDFERKFIDRDYSLLGYIGQIAFIIHNPLATLRMIQTVDKVLQAYKKRVEELERKIANF